LVAGKWDYSHRKGTVGRPVSDKRLSIWFSGLFRISSYWRVGIGLLAFGLLIEICQRAVGYRSAEWMDVAGDALGILAGLGLALLGLGSWCRHFETWWAGRREDRAVD
jgi:sulfite exporter TauE/SafE